jgi:hypothetical protein
VPVSAGVYGALIVQFCVTPTVLPASAVPTAPSS